MRSKFGKEKKLFTDEKFRVKYGTIDAVKLNAVYLNIDSWVKPGDIDNYDSYIRSMRKKVMLKIREEFDRTIFSENFIVDLDLRSSGMSMDKKSFMAIEVTLYPITKIEFNSDLMFKKMQQVSNIVIQSLEQNKLTYYSKKKS